MCLEKLQHQVREFADRALIEHCAEARESINERVFNFAESIVGQEYPESRAETVFKIAYDLFHNSMYAGLPE
jgi:hypothetical protein